MRVGEDEVQRHGGRARIEQRAVRGPPEIENVAEPGVTAQVAQMAPLALPALSRDARRGVDAVRQPAVALAAPAVRIRGAVQLALELGLALGVRPTGTGLRLARGVGRCLREDGRRRSLRVDRPGRLRRFSDRRSELRLDPEDVRALGERARVGDRSGRSAAARGEGAGVERAQEVDRGRAAVAEGRVSLVGQLRRRGRDLRRGRARCFRSRPARRRRRRSRDLRAPHHERRQRRSPADAPRVFTGPSPARS